MNIVRCILNDKGAPKWYWPKTSKWETLELNMSLTSVIKKRTLEKNME